ncbi:MAG: prepilin-type N-terminal cleavage/methylation domain-containing protein [Candidatus Parvarchaeota archaeon]
MQFLKTKKAFSILELMIALAVSLIIVAAAFFIYKDTIESYAIQRNINLVKETTKQTLMGLEMFLQEWGYGVPCSNSNVEQCNQVIESNNPNNIPFPPPSSLYIVINSGNPCDSVYFYGSLGGEGFIQSLASTNTVNVVSCELNTSQNQNCYYAWRGAKIFLNQNPSFGSTSTPLIFSLNNLTSNDSYCANISPSNPYNDTMSNYVTALNGQLIIYNGNQQSFTNQLNLDPGDLLIRVPSLIHIYCQTNPQDNNLWLYVSTTDMASPYCQNNLSPTPIVRVNSFHVSAVQNGVQVNIAINNNGNVININRFFGK